MLCVIFSSAAPAGTGALMPTRRGCTAQEEKRSATRRIARNPKGRGFTVGRLSMGLRSNVPVGRPVHTLEHMSNLIVIGFNNEADAVQLHQAVNLTAAGAASGALWGTLIGLFLLNPLLGAGMGAGFGALSGKLADIGINDQFMKDLGATLTPGSSALFVLVRKSTGCR